jgi:hypothetical protein
MLQAPACPATAGAALAFPATTIPATTIYEPPLQPVKVVLVAFGFKLGVPEYVDGSLPSPHFCNV